MVGKKKLCSVPDCYDQESVRHRFPKRPEDDDIYQIWLKRVNNPKLFNLSKEKVYQTHVVCDRHFDDSCRVPGWIKLKRRSVPTLHLSNFPDKTSSATSDVSNLPENEPKHGQTVLVEDSINVPMVDNQVILLNLDTFELHIVDAEDTSSLFQLENKEGESKEQDEKVESDTKEKCDSTNQESTVEIADEVLSDVQAQQSEKSYFKSVKSYLMDNHRITEVCRICFRSTPNEDVVKLYEETQREDVNKIKNMLKLVLPDLNLDIYPNSVVCKRCTDLLVYSYELKETWLTTEEKLQKIIKMKNGVTNRDADLVIVAKAVTNDRPVKEKPSIATEKMMKNILSENDQNVSVFVGDLNLKQTQLNHQLRYSNKIWGSGPWVCEVCGDISTKLVPFQSHLRRHYEAKEKVPEERQVMCELCGRLFTSVAKLKMHAQKHVVHRCKICSKVFNYATVLQKHIRHRHLKLYNYRQCHLCGKKLAHEGTLRMHLLIHNPKKLFPCHVCNKKFSMPSKLKNHLRRHSKEKLECEYCGRSIKYEWTLRKHIQIYHKNEAEFVCEFCNRPYWKKVDLMKHKIRIHGWGPDHDYTRRTSD